MRLERGTFVARETIQGIWIIHHIAETRGRHNELFSRALSLRNIGIVGRKGGDQQLCTKVYAKQALQVTT